MSPRTRQASANATEANVCATDRRSDTPSGFDRSTAISALRPGISEHQFQCAVIDLAKLAGWAVAHSRPARTERGWRTAVEGHAGMPDLVLARDGVLILAELKSAKGRVSPEQAWWLAALGEHGRLWRPADWPEIVAELTAKPRRATS